MNYNILRAILVIILLSVFRPVCTGQAEMPEVLKQGKMTEQLNYIEERTRIYDYYRAIREDMFQQIKRNTLDSLRASYSRIAELSLGKSRLNIRIDSLNMLVAGARAGLDEAIKTKNSIKVLGINVNKAAYNSVMWIIVASLAGTLLIGFLIFRRNLIVAKRTRTDLEELKAEFEEYRKQSRLAREKMSMDHFNEIRRLRARGTEHKGQGNKPDRTDDIMHFRHPEAAPASKPAGQNKSRNTVNEAAQNESTAESEDFPGEAVPVTSADTELTTKEDSTPETKAGSPDIPDKTKTSRKKKSPGKANQNGDQANLAL